VSIEKRMTSSSEGLIIKGSDDVDVFLRVTVLDGPDDDRRGVHEYRATMRSGR
jgi:hypothetical protein